MIRPGMAISRAYVSGLRTLQWHFRALDRGRKMRTELLLLLLALALCVTAERRVCVADDDCVDNDGDKYCLDVPSEGRICVACDPMAPLTQGGQYRDCPANQFCVGRTGRVIKGIEEYDDKKYGECSKFGPPLGDVCNPDATATYVDGADDTKLDPKYCGLAEYDAGQDVTYEHWTGACVNQKCHACYAHRDVFGSEHECVNIGFSGRGGTMATRARAGSGRELNQTVYLQVLLGLTFVMIVSLGVAVYAYTLKAGGLFPSRKY